MNKTLFKTTTLLALPALLALVGCGKNLTGNYGSTISLSTLTPSCTSNSVTTNIMINANSAMVTGSWSSSCMNATFNGTDNGQGTITNVIATVTPVTTSTYGNSGYGYGYNSNCVYNGSLNLINKVLSGTLTLQQSAITYSSTCSNSLTFNGTQTN